MYHETFLVSRKVPSEVCGDAERVVLKFFIHLGENKKNRGFFDTDPALETVDVSNEAT